MTNNKKSSARPLRAGRSPRRAQPLAADPHGVRAADGPASDVRAHRRGARSVRNRRARLRRRGRERVERHGAAQGGRLRAVRRRTAKPPTAAGAVNTISIVDGGLRGDNTDGVGFIRDVTVNLRQTLAGARIVVLGAGGAARGIIGPLLEREAGASSRSRIARRSAPTRSSRSSQCTMLVARGVRRARRASRRSTFSINATSAGLKGEAPPFPRVARRPA